MAVFDEDAEFAWAVGLFEGEGCIHQMARKDTGRVQRGLTLSTTDLDVAQRFLVAVGCGRLHGPYPNGVGCKLIHRWRCQAWPEIESLLRRMEPMLGRRRGEAARKLLANPPQPHYSHKRPLQTA